MSFYHIRSRERAKYEAVIHGPQCPGLTGLQQGEYRRMQKEQLWLNWTNRWMKIKLKIEAKITVFLCRIINLSFNDLA